MVARIKSASMPHDESLLLKILPFLGVLPFVFGAAAVSLSWLRA
jgi:hypothetical protein